MVAPMKWEPNHTEGEVKAIVWLTLKLVELRQKECSHLAVENIGPQIFHSLLTRLALHKQGSVMACDFPEETK